ncbi:MAG TPA: acyl-CoA dehydrogenase family protein, partial [Blastocatellia bacterium]|nr:acyl-CoA dehydrogenase family protein [Blastocatellia bacterium]
MTQLKEFRGTEGTDFFESDRGFQAILSDLLPEASKERIFQDLHECGKLAGGRWNDLAQEASRQENLPKIIKRDRAGNLVEKVDFGPLTRQLRREVAEFGVLNGTQTELHKFALVYYLAHNGEASLNCGLSCTDGLIRALRSKGSEQLRNSYLPKLLSVETPFAGAQFVTERAGGSDVGAIEMQAALAGDGSWSLTGEKWFCSNPDEFYLVAAKAGGSAYGTRGIGIFLVPRVLPNGRVNNLSFVRLKNKLGTQSLPTAEIEFNGATGFPIGDVEDGFKTLMNYVINVSRVHNAISSCAFIHRAFLEARNYARQREAFGHTLTSYPLIQESLIGMQETCWRTRLLTFRLISMLDKNGYAPPDEGEAMWQRFLINLAKYRTATATTQTVREAILIMGANGIVEDFSVMPRLLRDSMIIETWEGPHNTLCLQIVRDAARSRLLERWQAEISHKLETWPDGFMSYTKTRVEQAFREVEGIISSERLHNEVWASTHARRLVDSLGALIEITWMAETAGRHSGRDWTAALLTAAARHRLLPTDRLFDHPVLD